jgi:cytochrome c5
MPPKGGAMVSDEEIRAAIEDMLSNSGVDAAAATPAAAADPVEAMAETAGDAMDAAKTMAAAVMPAPVPAPSPAPAPEPAAAAAPESAPAAVPESAAADLAKGKTVYNAACFVCHATGAAGAPKLGDKALWAPRLAQGMDVLNTTALRGKGGMPPKGGRMDIPDADVLAAVAYMVNEAQ